MYCRGNAAEEQLQGGGGRAGLSKLLQSVRGRALRTVGRCNVPVPVSPQVGVNVPLIVRLEGTNVERGKEILRTSGLDLITARCACCSWHMQIECPHARQHLHLNGKRLLAVLRATPSHPPSTLPAALLPPRATHGSDLVDAAHTAVCSILPSCPCGLMCFVFAPSPRCSDLDDAAHKAVCSILPESDASSLKRKV